MTIRSFNWSLYVIAFFILCSHCISYGNPIFDHLTTLHGLSTNKVKDILQDREGFYWIATTNGLNRYDGSRFKIFLNNPDDPKSLSSNFCTSLLEDSEGNIWIGTQRGISKYIKSKACFQQIYQFDNYLNVTLPIAVRDLAIDDDGNIWATARGLTRYDVKNDCFSSYLENADPCKSFIGSWYITNLIYDKKNNGLWFVALSELNFFDLNTNRFYHRKNNPLNWKVFDRFYPNSIFLDRLGKLWYTARPNASLECFDIDNNKIINYPVELGNHKLSNLKIDSENRIWFCFKNKKAELYDLNTNKSDTGFFTKRHERSAVSEFVNNLYIDKSQTYWISSGDGISLYKKNMQYFDIHNLSFKSQSLKTNAIAQTDSTSVWIGTDSGLYKYNLANKTIAHVDKLNSAISSMCGVKDSLWIGFKKEILCYHSITGKILYRQNLAFAPVFLQSSSRFIWGGFWKNGIFRIDKRTGEIEYFKENSTHCLKSNRIVTGITYNDDLWVGFNAGLGFAKYDVILNEFINYAPWSNDPFNYHSGTISAIAKNFQGMLWLGTYGAGIYEFDPLTGLQSRHQQHHGLTSNYINSILLDHRENLWISTADGFCFMDSKNKVIRKLNPGLIFPDSDVVLNGYKGFNALYFFCENQLIEMFPERYTIDTNFSIIVVNSFKIKGKDTPLSITDSPVKIEAKDNFFSFEFSAIKPAEENDAVYAYMLKGYNKDWVYCGNNKFAGYTNLPSGNYQFKVKVMNDKGMWSPAMLNIPLIVYPYFWETWWFILLVVLFIGSLVYGIFIYHIRQLKNLLKLRTKIAEDLHDEVGSTLSSISIFSEIAQRQSKDVIPLLNTIGENSRKMMEAMSDIVWTINPENDEFTKIVMRMRNIAYELLGAKNIDFEFIASEEIVKTKLPMMVRKNIYLIFKESINNMVKYAEANKAFFSIEREQQKLVLLIRDNGKGFEMNSSIYGNGIKNMKKRADEIGANFYIESNPGKGTTIKLKMTI